MDKTEFKSKLDALYDGVAMHEADYHQEADDIMVEALTDLGFDCSVFTNAEKWYE